MGGAILTKQSEALYTELQDTLEKQIENAKNKKNEAVLKVQNSTIRKVQKLNIEYKYTKATQSMIHDGEKSQASSMLGALKYLGILAR